MSVLDFVLPTGSDHAVSIARSATSTSPRRVRGGTGRERIISPRPSSWTQSAAAATPTRVAALMAERMAKAWRWMLARLSAASAWRVVRELA